MTIPRRQLFLEGAWRDGSAAADIRSPWDGRVVSSVAQASLAQMEAAVEFAHAHRARVAAQSAGHRRGVLLRVAEGLKADREAIAQSIVAEAGKPIALARVEVDRAQETFLLAAAELTRFGGEVVPVDLTPGTEAAEAEVRRFPVGVVAGIVPFNFPLNLGAHKVAPALAVGAPIIVKPPPQAPSGQLLLAKLVQAAGAEAAALQVLPCANVLAERLATDARVRVVSFTGSARVGWHLKAAVPGRTVLELGGNAAAIVRADADLAHAANRLAVGAFAYAGQVCISVQRIYVEAPVFEAFQKHFLARVDALGVGDPALESTLVGPLIDDAARQRVQGWVQEALDQGAKQLRGGEATGRLVSPLVLTQVPRAAKLAQEEVFGPVVVLEPVADLDEAIARVNDSRFGLQAGLFTDSQAAIRRAFHGLEVGGVIVNDGPTFRSDNMPYGGIKGSGLGREGPRYAMEDFTEARVLVRTGR